MQTYQFFKDPCFENGFIVHGPRHEDGYIAAYPGHGAEQSVPRWMFGQWGVYRHPLTAATPRTALPGGGYRYTTDTMDLQVRPSGSPCRLRMEQRAGREYQGAVRKQGEDWPHFLLEQRNMHVGAPRLGQLDKLLYTADFKLEYCRCNMPDDRLDPGLHTAQVSHYFTVAPADAVDVPPPAGGQYFWFGLPYFDARWPLMPGQLHLDDGKADCSGMMIVCPPQTEFCTVPAAEGRWQHYRTDLLPYIRRALEAAQSKGLHTDWRWQDLVITSNNFGFELPGDYDAAMCIGQLSLEGVWPAE